MRLVAPTAMVISICLCCLGGGLARAQEPAPATETGDTLGWHIVRPGDTLEAITEHYLGTSLLWRENWRLNPSVKDPHLLRIGSRLRVVLHRELPPRTTEVLQVQRRVEQKPHPNPWMPANQGDLLQEQDGVRTFRRSSTVLGFDDGTRLVLTEDSLVFLREVRRSVLGESRETIEVVSGQADLEARPLRPARAADIEVVLGPVSAAPRPDASGLNRSRLRRQESGASQVMVYDGATGVAAAGARVEVAAGMGTSVPPAGPPEPPRRLLPAPALTQPPAGTSLAFANPLLSWAAVPGAATYTGEVCADAGCEQLVDRAPAITGTSWQPSALPAGELFWRVTAIDGAGLDGFPSPGRRLLISGDKADTEPPVVVAWIDGVQDGERLLTRPGAVIGIAAHDDVAGVAVVELRWDEDGWQAWTGEELQAPQAGGRHRLQLRARDLAGHESPTWSIELEVDDQQPPPPEVSSPALPSG